MLFCTIIEETFDTIIQYYDSNISKFLNLYWGTKQCSPENNRTEMKSDCYLNI